MSEASIALLDQVLAGSPAARPETRYEIKLVCEHHLHSEIQSWVRLHSAGFRPTYPARQVNNIYFDTLDMDSFNDHIESVPERRKFRFRWYGEWQAQRPARGQLEIKSKSERAGWKATLPLEAGFDLHHQSWNEVMRQMRGCASGIFRNLLDVTRPVTVNRYWREYYAAGDGQVRLTLDSRVYFYDQVLAVRPNLSFHNPALNMSIIELKCPVSLHKELADIVSEFPLRVVRNSKYVNALSGFLER